MKLRITRCVAALVVTASVVLGLISTAEAALVSARASSEFPDGRWAANTVNGSGLVGDSHVLNPPQTMWLTSGAADTEKTITFDLGAVYTVDSMRVWNYNENANPTCCMGRSIATADILVAGEDQVFSTHIAGQTFALAPGTESDFSETISLGGVAARYIKFDNTATHSDATYTGLSEVQFSADLVPGQTLPLPATIHEVSSNLSGFDRVADYLVDRSGLLGNTHHIQPQATMWLNQGSFVSNPPAPADLDPYIVFDMGSVVPLARAQIWNYNEILPDREDLLLRGVSSLDISVSDNGVDFTPVIVGQALAQAPGDDSVDFSETIPLDGVEARYVKFDNMVGFDGVDNAFVGLSEVQFYAVPEPSTLLLLGASVLGLLVAAGRRRRRPA
jgi:hypothetical protein